MSLFSSIDKKRASTRLFKACLFLLLILSPGMAHATTLSSGGDTSGNVHFSHSGASGNDRPNQPLGTGFSNTGGHFFMHMKGDASATGAQSNALLESWTSKSAFEACGAQASGCTGGADVEYMKVGGSTTYSVDHSGSDYVEDWEYTATLNPSLYYSVYVPQDSGTNYGATAYVNATTQSATANARATNGLCSFNGNCPQFAIGLYSLYFEFTDTGGTTTPPPPDTSTHIVDFTPEDHATTTNPVHFSMHAYVNPADLGTFIGVKFTLHNIDQNVLLLSAFSPSDIYFLDGFNATTTGDFYFSTTTYIGEGNYRINAILERSYLDGWIVNPFSPISQDLSHQFIVGTPTFIGTISQNGYSELQSIFASTTATSTSALAGTCNPLGSFDIIKCGTFLLVPGGDYLATTMQGLKDGVLTRVPWGYLTRMYSIWNTSATTTLPSFTVHVITGPGDNSNMSTTSLAFDPGDMIAGAGALLDSIHDPINGKTAKDVFGPLVQLAIALSVILTIIADLSGSHKHHTDAPQKKLS